jgi:acetyl esterase/lipase
MRKRLLLAFALIAGCNTEDAPTPVGVPASAVVSFAAKTVDTVALDYAYTSTNSPHQRFDVFRPHRAARTIPAVVCIHGGGWITGDKAMSPDALCWASLAHGMAIVALNYRLSGDSVWPAQMHDVFTAIRCVRTKASQFGIDPLRLGVFGGSAGAHLAMMAGVTSDSSLLGLSLGCKKERSDVKAVVSMFGPADFLAIDNELAQNGCPYDPTSHDNLLHLLGMTSMTTRQDSMKVASISPVNNIRRVLPMQMWNGDLDCTVPYQQMTDMSKAMALRGGAVEVNMAYGFGHGFKDPTIADSASSFLYRIRTH